jgi:hypothetical protein
MLALLLVVARASSAGAQSDDELRKARAHYQAGSALYDAHSYEDAVREFWAGYRLSPRPEFLLNLGQSYRKLDDLPHARALFARFLKEASPDAPERPQAQKLLERIDGEISARLAPPPDAIAAASPTAAAASPTASPAPALPVSPPVTSPAPVAPAPVAPPAAMMAPAAMVMAPVAAVATGRRSFWRRHWWIAPVGGVVVTAVVVGLAVGLTLPSTVGCGDSGVIGCVKVPSSR